MPQAPKTPSLWETMQRQAAPQRTPSLWETMQRQTRPSPLREFLGTVTHPVFTLMDYLNRSLYGTAGGVLAAQQGRPVWEATKAGLKGEEKHTWEDVLEEAGVEPGTGRTVAGFGLDVLADPINLVGGLPFKLAAKAGKALKLGEKVPKALRAIPFVPELEKAFRLYPDLPAPYVKARRLLESEKAFTREKAFEDAVQQYLGKTPFARSKTTAAERVLISNALDEGKVASLPPKLRTLAEEAQTSFRQQAQREAAAGVLLPEKIRERYVPHIYKDRPKELAMLEEVPGIRATSPFSKPRKLETFKQAEAAGFTPEKDIAKLAALRQYIGERALLHARFLDNLTTAPELKGLVVPIDQARKGFRSVRVPAASGLKERLADFAFDTRVADDLEKMVKILDDPNKIGRLWSAATQVWKGYATVLRPAFHFRNLVSNMFNSHLGDMSVVAMPARYAEATAILTRAAKPGKIGQYSSEAISEGMRRMGVIGTEFGVVGDLGSAIERGFSYAQKTFPGQVAARLNPLSPHFAPLVGGRAAGRSIEDTSRLALFLDRLRKGDKMEDAALWVKKYLFDYQELTDLERKIRGVGIPFYTWIRKNIPLQLEGLIKRPQDYAATGKGFQALERKTQEKGFQVPTEQRPQYIQEEGYAQLPIQTQAGEAVFMKSGLPFEDLLTIPRAWTADAAAETLRDLGSMMHPFLKALVEVPTEKSLFTNAPLINQSWSELRPTNDALSALADAAPKIAMQLGLHKIPTMTRGQQWQAPAWFNYGLSMIPTISTVGRAGKAARGGEPEEIGGGQIGGLAPPGVLNLFAPVSLAARSKAQLRLDLRSRLRRALAQKRRQLRIEGMTIPLEDLLFPQQEEGGLTPPF